MKKHILSKKCWCKPEVISFKEPKEDKILQIAALFNDSMDNVKYNKIRKILKSLQMEIEVETGLKNFQVTMKELANARREVIDKVEKMINTKYPPNRFTEYTNDSNVMTMSRGVQEETCIRRLDERDKKYISFLEHVLATLKEEQI